LKTALKAPVKSLVVSPAVRAGRTMGAGLIYAFGSEEAKMRADELLARDTEVNLGLLGKYNIEAVKPGAAGLKQAAGEALEAGSYLVGGGAAPAAIKSTLGRGIVKGATAGAVSGGAFGAGTALQEDASIEEALKRGATGSLAGAAFGAAIPPAVAGATGAYRGIRGAFAGRAAQEAEKSALLRGVGGDLPPDGGGGGGGAGPGGAVPDARIAKVKLEDGKVVADPVGKEAVRQGIPEADVALIKTSGAADKIDMAEMLDIRQRLLTNKRETNRATDVVGRTFVENLAKPIENLNKEARKRLDLVAQRLAGSKIDTSSAMSQFDDALAQAGVTPGPRGTLNFKNSNFEGLRGVQQLITNVYKRAIRVARSGDALQAHRMKSYIDEIVNYGKQAEGLSGRAQAMLKEFRHNIDAILDARFLAYNKVNTQYADTIRELDKMSAAIGRKFRLGDTFSDAQAGLAMRRILSNTQSRAEILKLLDDMQRVGMKYGVKMDKDVIAQANFADVLEKMLGTEAPTSFLGQVERGVEGIGGAGADIARGRVVSGTIKAGKYLLDITRGVNQENKINALRALLKREAGQAKTGSVFGRPKGDGGVPGTLDEKVAGGFAKKG
jgi:hypothetical protein